MAAASGGKYVPPSRRAGYVLPSTSTLPPGHSPRQPPTAARRREPVYALSEIEHAFNCTQHSSINFFAYRYPYVEQPVEHRPERLWRPNAPQGPLDDAQAALSDLRISTGGQETTTRGEVAKEQAEQVQGAATDSPSSEKPPSPPAPTREYESHPLGHLISYITLFPNAHPAWESDRELWAHTSADRLVDDWGSGKKINFGRPLPVFRAASPRKGPMVFDGWWVLDALRSVEPNSDELREMLIAKEQGKSYVRSGRTAQAWHASLQQRWIKLRLSPASPERWPDLKNPMNMLGGVGGEIEAYMLDLAGLLDEKAKLAEAHEQQRKFDEESKATILARRGMRIMQDHASEEGPNGDGESAP